MTMEETDALCDAYWRAAGAHVRSDGAVSVYGLLAVAAKARELDAARGGTLSAEDVARHVAQVRACGAEVSCGILSGHLAAQGRTIAEKDARIAELEAEHAETRAMHSQMCGVAIAHQKDRDDARDAQRAAESALTTLRRMVVSAFGAWQQDAGVEVAMTDLLMCATTNATPSEHPDTATLRAIRERGNDDDRMLEAMDDAPISPDLLRDSDGDEGWAKVRAQARALRDYLLGDSGPSGGGEKVPTTQPAVAASEGSLFDACVDGSCEHSHAGTPSHIACGRKMAALPENRPLSTGAVATTPTPDEDLRLVQNALNVAAQFGPGWAEQHNDAACAALARLKAEPRRAAERMRHRADVAVLMLQPPASLLKQCETSAEANAVRGAWCAAINAAVDAIRALEVTP